MQVVGEFGFYQILLAAGLVLATILLSRLCGLELERTFAVSATRCFVQLSLIGFALRWLFAKESLLLNLSALFVMTLVAGQTVVSRAQTKSWRLFAFALISLVGSVWVLALPSFGLVFGRTAIFEAKLFVPLMGLLLGNTLSAISLVFIQLQRTRRENMREVETFYALGATSWESGARLYKIGLRQSLTPILNSMSVVGLVSLPGTMAGQVLGGVDPLLAGRVQIVIMFLMLLSAVLGTLIAVALYHHFEMPKWLRGQRDIWMIDDSKHRKFGISGASGVGKSRFVKSLAGLDDRDICRELLDRSNLKAVRVDDALYISQQPVFAPGTVLENIELPFRFRKNRALRLNKVYLQNFLSGLGFPEDFTGKSAMTLSGGEGQIVHLIRGLLLGPKLLFLDEPTSALDRSRRDQLEAVLLAWVEEDQERRFVIISHDDDQRARLSDIQYVLSEKRLRPIAPPVPS